MTGRTTIHRLEVEFCEMIVGLLGHTNPKAIGM